MRKAKPLEKGSFLQSVLRALGMDKDSALPSLSKAEIKPSDAVICTSHGSTWTALLEAEQAKGKAIMELQRKPIA